MLSVSRLPSLSTGEEQGERSPREPTDGVLYHVSPTRYSHL